MAKDKELFYSYRINAKITKEQKEYLESTGVPISTYVRELIERDMNKYCVSDGIDHTLPF